MKTDISTGEYRLTMGLDALYDGIGFVPLSMGLFGLAEIMVNLEAAGRSGLAAKPVSGLLPGLSDLARAFPAMLRGTLVGAAFGILPGGGPTIAAFSAYSLEKKVSRTPERFGQGDQGADSYGYACGSMRVSAMPSPTISQARTSYSPSSIASNTR